MLKALNHRIDRISKQKVQPSNNREFPHSPQQLRLDSFKSQNCAARDMPPIIFHFTGQEQLQSPGFHPIISQNHIAPKSIRSENPQINFLTLPREIRQTILLMAVEGSMIRCYTLSKISRRWAISGFWDDLNYAAYKMIGSLKMLEEQDIVGDMEWVVRRSSDTLSVRRGQWVVRRDMTGNLNRHNLEDATSNVSHPPTRNSPENPSLSRQIINNFQQPSTTSIKMKINPIPGSCKAEAKSKYLINHERISCLFHAKYAKPFFSSRFCRMVSQ
ncbi:Geranylgeranyl pyrophosphate synthase [Venturia nashicola]|uniref:Geranylgeranyl pyrophosphate synthase n=1 Tax=Venturia nashicola TaxID=86259 RepID=A0A4Z1PCU0_9PEZI|nr:Geranylgeranyl pyrophosphate synthase [Venturia nashicola]